MIADRKPQNSIFGYADQLQARPGDVVSFKISSEGDKDYSASLVRIVNGGVESEHNQYHEIQLSSGFEGVYGGKHKDIYTGSYAEIDFPSALLNAESYTVQFFLCPTRQESDHDMTILAVKDQHDTGWKLSLHGGVLSVHSLSGGAAAGTLSLKGISKSKWHLIAVSFAGASVSLRIWQYERHFHPAAKSHFLEAEGIMAGVHPRAGRTFYLGAEPNGFDRNGQSVVTNPFDGKVASLRMASGVSSLAEIFGATDYLADRLALPSLVGVWNFAEARNLTFRNELCRHEKGRLFNLPLLGVTGAHWDGTRHNFNEAPAHFNAVHFHSDDVYDCGWETDFTYQIPDDLKSAIYAAKLVNADGDVEYIPFFVAPAKSSKSHARIAVVLPTMSYLAYGNDRMSTEQVGFDIALWNGQIVPDERSIDRNISHPGFGGSLYDCHPDGTGHHNSSWLRPIMTMRPNTSFWTLSADTLITSWLEQQGFDYDIITDHLLHAEGADLLAGYSAVISGNHPEYVTREMIEAISHYTTNLAGRFIYMGGNGYYWVTGVYDAAPAAVEIRRGVAGSGAWQSKPGEHHLFSTGELGGLWRHVGRAPQQVFGVGTRGMGFPGSIGYALKPDWNNPRVAFLVDGVTEEVLGDYGILGGGAAGEETDAVDFNLGTPAHALVVARSSNHPEGMMLAREDQNFPVPAAWTHHHVRADLTFFETPSGGAMLSVGSMAWCGSLSHNGGNNGVSRLTANALRRFLDPTPFKLP